VLQQRFQNPGDTKKEGRGEKNSQVKEKNRESSKKGGVSKVKKRRIQKKRTSRIRNRLMKLTLKGPKKP